MHNRRERGKKPSQKKGKGEGKKRERGKKPSQKKGKGEGREREKGETEGVCTIQLLTNFVGQKR